MSLVPVWSRIALRPERRCLVFYLDTLLWPLVSQQEPASTMGGAGETSEKETSGQVR